MANVVRDTNAATDFDVLAAAFLAGFASEPTRRAYDLDLRTFADWCASRDLNPLAVARRDIELYARTLEARDLAKRTRCRRLGTVSMFFRTLVYDGLAEMNPVDHVRRPKVERESTTNGLRRTELADVLEHAEKAGNAHELALVCLLGLNGLRVAEACSLTIENLDAERGMATIRFRRKGDKMAKAPLSPMTSWAVGQAIGGRASGSILLNQSGRPMTTKNAWLVVRRLCIAVGITRRISPHSFRHAFVTLSLDAASVIAMCRTRPVTAISG